MRRSVESRRRSRPADTEIAAPPRELPADPALEFTAPPEEFPPPGASRTADAEPKKRRRLIRAFMALAAAILSVWLFVREAPAAPAPTPAPEAAAVVTPTPSPTPAPTPEPTPTPAPEPTPSYPVYPLGGGTIRITVYEDVFKDYFDESDAESRAILLQETIPEADFTELALPYDAVRSYDPFVFVGFILHYGNDFDEGFVPGIMPFTVVLEDTLTREDVERVPVSEDGVRYVNIHVMWRDEDELITDPSQYGLALTLDDGMGNRTVVEAKNPLFSEGYTYLEIFPVPEREGYTFTGWYDEDGNRVYYVTFFQFFNEIETEWGIDYDWQNPRSVILTAGWEKNG